MIARQAIDLMCGLCRDFGRILGCAGVGLALTCGTAFASALPPSVILTLPTGRFITGAAVTLGLSAILGAQAHRLPSLTVVRPFWLRLDGPRAKLTTGRPGAQELSLPPFDPVSAGHGAGVETAVAGPAAPGPMPASVLVIFFAVLGPSFLSSATTG